MARKAAHSSASADVVVVGGGVIGTAIAFQASRLGAGRVLLVERSGLAGAATGRSGAVIRTHYTNAPEAAMAAAALPWFAEWADRVGGDCGFDQTGFLQLVTSQDRELLGSNVAMLQALGIDTRLVDASDIRELQPGLAVEDGEVAVYEPLSGYADPVATTQAFADAATRLGAEIRTGTQVRQLLMDGERVAGVVTDQHERIAAGTVVLANGAWSSPLLGSLGIKVPLQILRAQRASVSTPARDTGRRVRLAVIDRRYGIYTRPVDDQQTLVGLSGAAQSEHTDSADELVPDEGLGALALARLARAFPDYRASQVLHAIAGPLDVTPDHCALVGPVPGIDGLLLAVGMSGSGFKKAPAIGACVAELITTGEATTADLGPFRPDRFERGLPIGRRDYIVGGGEHASREALIH